MYIWDNWKHREIKWHACEHTACESQDSNPVFWFQRPRCQSWLLKSRSHILLIGVYLVFGSLPGTEKRVSQTLLKKNELKEERCSASKRKTWKYFQTGEDRQGMVTTQNNRLWSSGPSPSRVPALNKETFVRCKPDHVIPLSHCWELANGKPYCSVSSTFTGNTSP